jgi:hypothetical protein
MQSVAALPQVGLRDLGGWTWIAVSLLGVLLVAVSLEQGALAQLLMGAADGGGFLHELFHDGRHLLGFPCH